MAAAEANSTKAGEDLAMSESSLIDTSSLAATSRQNFFDLNNNNNGNLDFDYYSDVAPVALPGPEITPGDRNFSSTDNTNIAQPTRAPVPFSGAGRPSNSRPNTTPQKPEGGLRLKHLTGLLMSFLNTL